MTADLRLVAVLAVFMVACSNSSSQANTSSSARTNSPTAAIESQAADLRTHLDLLLAEQVMIVAKETAAAVNHSDSYTSYTSLLSTNLSDLTDLIGRAFGNSAADQFSQSWSKQNGYLVDYAIGVVTHNDSKASDAMSGLTKGFVPEFATLVTDFSGLPTDPITQLTTQQVLEDKAFIDDVSAQKYPAFYNDLLRAYAQSSRFGDALAERIAEKFPDKFPGDPTVPSVDRRVSLNLLLQQHALLATMATDAAVSGRDQDKSAATAALGVDADSISRSLSDLFGTSTGTEFDKVWAARDSGLLTYAQKGDADSRKALTATAPQFASLGRVQGGPVNDEMNELIKVIDEQRGKTLRTIAGDDRAAATSMEPIADAIVASAKS